MDDQNTVETVDFRALERDNRLEAVQQRKREQDAVRRSQEERRRIEESDDFGRF